MPTWIDDRGATLEKLRQHGRLWVCERLPCRLDKTLQRFDILADSSDDTSTLMHKWWWLFGPGPVADDQLQAQFHAVLARMGPVALVVHDAHTLKGSTLDKMRLLPELKGCDVVVVLQGDVSAIDMATRSCPSFYQRAAYCIEVERGFF